MNEESLFATALEKAAGAERQAFLDGACGGDIALRQFADLDVIVPVGDVERAIKLLACRGYRPERSPGHRRSSG